MESKEIEDIMDRIRRGIPVSFEEAEKVIFHVESTKKEKQQELEELKVETIYPVIGIFAILVLILVYILL